MKKSIVLMAVIVLITAGCHRAVASEETELPDSESVTASDTETTAWKDSYDTLPDITLETETSAPENISKDTDWMDVYHIPYHIEYDESGIDYSQYVIENEEDFVKWYGSGLEDARWYLGEAQIQSGSIAFTPIELIVPELPSDHYRALRTEDGLYLFEHNGGIEIWKDGKGFTIYSDRIHTSFTLNQSMWIRDVTGDGIGELLIHAYTGGEEVTLTYTWVIDLVNMEVIEYEPSGPYFAAAMESFIKIYSMDENNLTEGYDFYLTDKFFNIYNGFSHWMTLEEDPLRQQMCVLYSDHSPSGVSSRENKAMITVTYRYDENEGRFVVDRYEVEMAE